MASKRQKRKKNKSKAVHTPAVKTAPEENPGGTETTDRADNAENPGGAENPDSMEVECRETALAEETGEQADADAGTETIIITEAGSDGQDNGSNADSQPELTKVPAVLPAAKASSNEPVNPPGKGGKKLSWRKREIYAEVEGPGFIRRSPIRSWFTTFMIMNLPIIGWFHLLILALNPRADQRKDFAKAYLIYKLVFLLIGLALLAVVLYVGLDVIEQVLRYMDKL